MEKKLFGKRSYSTGFFPSGMCCEFFRIRFGWINNRAAGIKISDKLVFPGNNRA